MVSMVNIHHVSRFGTNTAGYRHDIGVVEVFTKLLQKYILDHRDTYIIEKNY